MINQTQDYSGYRILFILNIGLMLMFLVFITVIMKKYLEKRKKISLYLGIHYIFYFVASIFYGISQYQLYTTNQFAIPTKIIVGIALGLTTYGVIFLLGFYQEITKVNPKHIKALIIAGLILATYTALPFDELWGFELVAFILQFFYNLAVYIPIAIKMFQTAKNVDDQKRALNAIGLGAILMLMVMLFNTMGGMTTGNAFVIFNTIGIIVEAIALYMFFLGYIQPALSGKVEK
jgi:hypothetical protein